MVSWAPCLPPAVSGSGVRCGRVCWARVSAVPSPSWPGCRGVFFFCAFVFFSVPGFVVPVPPSPFFRAELVALFLFFPFRCPFSWWAAVPGLVLPVLGGWSPCASLGVLSSLPSGGGVWPPLVVLAGGLAAVGCFRAFSPSPLLFFGGGGACLFLPLPSLGWRTHWPAFSVVFRAAVFSCVLFGRVPAPWVRWAMYTVGSAPLLAGLGPGSAAWAAAAGGCLWFWVRGLELFVSFPLCGAGCNLLGGPPPLSPGALWPRVWPAVLVCGVLAPYPEDTHSSVGEWVQEQQAKVDKAKAMLQRVRGRQWNKKNKHRVPATYQEGDWVLVHHSRLPAWPRSTSDDPYFGPYKILSVDGHRITVRCSPRLGGTLVCAAQHLKRRSQPEGVVPRSQQKNNTKLRKRRTASKNKAKNRFFRPQKPPKKFYAAVWRGRKI